MAAAQAMMLTRVVILHVEMAKHGDFGRTNVAAGVKVFVVILIFLSRWFVRGVAVVGYTVIPVGWPFNFPPGGKGGGRGESGGAYSL